MKKIVIALGMIGLFAFSSCKKDEKIPEPVPATPPVENPAPTPQPVTEEADGTSISVDKNGVEVKTKDGETKTDINVSKESGSVEIKTPK